MATPNAAKPTAPSTPRKRTAANPKAETAAKPAAKRTTRAKAATTTTAAPKKRTVKAKAVAPVAVETPVDEAGFSEQVARLAYQFWQERGCPEGSSHEDWFRAEEHLLRNQG